MQKNNICIIDYGSGNVQSVKNIFLSISDSVKVSSDPKDIDNATHLVLPGVGAFGAAIKKIRELNILDALEANVIKGKKPFLGICVGMQILADRGYEYGTYDGLGWIPGEVKRMDVGDLRLPHVGWNNLENISESTTLLKGLSSSVDFYFVHSYSFRLDSNENLDATFTYGGEFTAAVKKDNIFGVQFHPEKSQKAGKVLLENFLSI